MEEGRRKRGPHDAGSARERRSGNQACSSCGCGVAVEAANAAIGRGSIGSPKDQVGRLMRETGIQATRGCAPVPLVSPAKPGMEG